MIPKSRGSAPLPRGTKNKGAHVSELGERVHHDRRIETSMGHMGRLQRCGDRTNGRLDLSLTNQEAEDEQQRGRECGQLIEGHKPLFLKNM